MSDAFETTIGLEIHVELATASKMFCSCPVAFGGEPNTRTCPVCLGLPGALPVPNRKAVEYTIRIGLALNCRIAERAGFHRKNYFYPDMPKNYQISQYDEPLCVRGHVDVPTEDGVLRVGITRVHLEEDTGKSVHVGGSGRIADSDRSLEDFNRAGTPLVEIVSEPDIHSAEQARAFVSELRAILASLGVSDVRMEEGSLRVDANVSVRPVGEGEHGAKVEVKNMNSIRSVGRALQYEEARQRDALRRGEMPTQETRHFDERTGRTSAMRTKEFAFDYRYFPEPDLVPLTPSRAWVEEIAARLPELPAARRARFAADYALPAADVAVLTASPEVARWFEEAVAAYGGEPKRIANWVTGDLFGLLNDAGVELTEAKVTPAGLAALVRLVDAGRISGKQAKGVLQAMFDSGAEPEAIVAERGLEQVSDEAALQGAVDEAIAANPDAADKVRAGNLNTIGFLVGQVMRRTGGRADPRVVNELLRRKLVP